MTGLLIKSYKCDFCDRECTFRVIPPEQAAIRNNLPFSYSNLGPSGDLDRCVKCQKICCQVCSQNAGFSCPSCGGRQWEIAFRKDIVDSMVSTESKWWQFRRQRIRAGEAIATSDRSSQRTNEKGGKRGPSKQERKRMRKEEGARRAASMEKCPRCGRQEPNLIAVIAYPSLTERLLCSQCARATMGPGSSGINMGATAKKWWQFWKL